MNLLTEVVEAQGHLIDSHIMEQIFDTVVEYHGRFEVEEFRIGKTNSDGSYLRLKIEAGDGETMEQLLSQLIGLGCSPVDASDAALKIVERECCAPEDFYSTTNQRTLVRHGNQWLGVKSQRMDALVGIENGEAFCPRLPDVRTGDKGGTGMPGNPVIPQAQQPPPPPLPLISTHSP